MDNILQHIFVIYLYQLSLSLDNSVSRVQGSDTIEPQLAAAGRSRGSGSTPLSSRDHSAYILQDDQLGNGPPQRRTHVGPSNFGLGFFWRMGLLDSPCSSCSPWTPSSVGANSLVTVVTSLPP